MKIHYNKGPLTPEEDKLCKLNAWNVSGAIGLMTVLSFGAGVLYACVKYHQYIYIPTDIMIAPAVGYIGGLASLLITVPLSKVYTRLDVRRVKTIRDTDSKKIN